MMDRRSLSGGDFSFRANAISIIGFRDASPKERKRLP